MKNFVKKYALAFAIIVTAVLALVLRLIMIGDIPRGWNVDEAGIAYDAWCIANMVWTGSDILTRSCL